MTSCGSCSAVVVERVYLLLPDWYLVVSYIYFPSGGCLSAYMEQKTN